MTRSTAPTPSSTTTRNGIHLAARRLDWDFSAVPACPVEGDAELAAFLLALSYFVVAFEDFGIPAVREHLTRLAGHPLLEREARMFVAQEALHSQAHAQFNAMMERRHGLRTETVHRACRDFADELRRGTEQEQLAAVVALEHVIYSVADWYENAAAVHARVHPDFHRLLLWHAMEETEHTAVAFDVYEHVYGTSGRAYRIRLRALARASAAGLRAMLAIRRALLSQLIGPDKPRSSRIGPWSAFVREASRYTGDCLGFVAPKFSPLDKAPAVELLPGLRRQLLPVSHGTRADWLRLRVASAHSVASDTIAYELVTDDGAPLPSWKPGAHIEVEIEPGILRPYSLCGDPYDATRYSIAVRRQALGRGGSLRLHQMVRVGSSLRASSPRNNFELVSPEAAETLLVAGGIGVTPLLAMARVLHAHRQRFSLHLCARTRTSLPFGGEIDTWPFRDAVHVHLDGGKAQHGAEVALQLPRWEDAWPRALYLCGPAGFVASIRAKATAAGWPAAAVHTEQFSTDPAVRHDDRAFTLHLARSDVMMQVKAGQTILDALENHGLRPQHSCREGVCGACVCKVVAGQVDHRDAVLSQEEQRDSTRIAICVSRAQGGSLSLDL